MLFMHFQIQALFVLIQVGTQHRVAICGIKYHGPSCIIRYIYILGCFTLILSLSRASMFQVNSYTSF